MAKTCATLINEPTLSNLSRCSCVSSDNVTESAIESIRRIDSLSAKIDDKGSILPVFGAFDHHAEIASMGIRLKRALASIIHRPWTIIGDGTADRQAIAKRGRRISVRPILEGLDSRLLMVWTPVFCFCLRWLLFLFYGSASRPLCRPRYY